MPQGLKTSPKAASSRAWVRPAVHSLARTKYWGSRIVGGGGHAAVVGLGIQKLSCILLANLHA